MEIWRDVRDMEGYKVSNYGKIQYMISNNKKINNHIPKKITRFEYISLKLND